MVLSISAALPNYWKYVSEGGASIVFSYCGPPNPDFDSTVLRLRKVPVDYQPSLIAEPLVEEPDDPTIAFQHQIIQKLIPIVHLPRLESVEVNRGWLQELRDLSETERPAERRAIDTIDLIRRKAVLATDLVGGQALAVEIKVCDMYRIDLYDESRPFSPAKVGVSTVSCTSSASHEAY